jgi:hypothetical protein
MKDAIKAAENGILITMPRFSTSRVIPFAAPSVFLGTLLMIQLLFGDREKCEQY